MIRKILSCGEPGAALAALDAAVELGIAHGGWVAPVGSGENADFQGRYDLQQIVDGGPAEALRRNMMDSDGTLSIGRGKGGFIVDRIRQEAEETGRGWLHIDLNESSGFQAARQISDWVLQRSIATLHVTGTGAHEVSDVYRATRNILEAFFYMDLMKEGNSLAHGVSHGQAAEALPPPRTVTEAVERLMESLPLKDKVTMANMALSELASLDRSLGEYIRTQFGLWSENRALLDSCRWRARDLGKDGKNAAGVIIFELWKELKKTYSLRIIK